MTSDTARPKGPAQEMQRREMFAVYLTLSGTVTEFDDSREAGRAFFGADPAERPTVTHVVDNTARTMARTEIHGAHASGEPRYFKSLPASHASDVAFREGFLEAMEQSIVQRLGQIAVEIKGSGHVARIDARLHDDLEAFAYREPQNAATIWNSHAWTPQPGLVLKAAVETHGAGLDHPATEGPLASQTQMPKEHAKASEAGAGAKRKAADQHEHEH